MTVKTMEDLFVDTLKDIYYAEKHILKALPGMVKKAGNKQLKEALETHRKETEGQVDRLDQVFKLMDVAPRGKKCEAIEGILAEAKEHMEDIEDAEVLDAGMIGSAQAVEHYEITRYGTLIAWAKQLGRDDAIRPPREPTSRKRSMPTSLLDADRRGSGQSTGRRVSVSVCPNWSSPRPRGCSRRQEGPDWTWSRRKRAGTTRPQQRCADQDTKGCARGEKAMDSIIYLVGLVVVIMFILSFLGLR